MIMASNSPRHLAMKILHDQAYNSYKILWKFLLGELEDSKQWRQLLLRTQQADIEERRRLAKKKKDWQRHSQPGYTQEPGQDRDVLTNFELHTMTFEDLSLNFLASLPEERQKDFPTSRQTLIRYHGVTPKT